VGIVEFDRKNGFTWALCRFDEETLLARFATFSWFRRFGGRLLSPLLLLEVFDGIAELLLLLLVLKGGDIWSI